MAAGGFNDSKAATWIRRRRRRLAIAGAALITTACVVAAVSWHFSSAVLVPDHSDWPENIAVEAVPSGRIVLSRSDETERPGVHGIAWQGGHAILGAITARADDTVTRRLRAARGYLAPGMKVAISRVHVGNPRQALGLPFADVRVPGELGPMPAWLIPGDSDTWAIVVHGINDSPQGALRMAPALHRVGLPALLITYREDLGAPASPDGLHHMGATEWRDLEAAVRYALSRGAEQIVLAGYSMGGSIVTQFMQNSELAPRVASLVLDAPALDWRETIKFNATEMGMPSFSTLPMEWAIGARIDVDWKELDAVQHPEAFQLPILLFHGTEDEVVPISISEEFAEELPRHVTYYRAPHAGHTEAWNVNPKLYERRLEVFLSLLNSADPSGNSSGARW